MLFIVRTQAEMIMSQDLTWLEIRKLSQEDKENLLSVPNQISAAQRLCKWFVSDRKPVSPLKPKTIRTKWGVDLSMVDENTFESMIQAKRCPEYLRTVPANENQIAAFQEEWVKEGTAVPAAPAQTDAPVIPAAQSEPEPESAPAQQLNFLSTAIPVKERSDLINEMISIFSAFGELTQKIPEMLKDRQNELSLVEKKLLDLQHIAELSDNLNVVEGYRFYKEQRDALRRRRTLKDEIFALSAASNILSGEYDPAKICRFVKSIEGLDGRLYRPRAISESEVAEIIQNPKTLDTMLGK